MICLISSKLVSTEYAFLFVVQTKHDQVGYLISKVKMSSISIASSVINPLLECSVCMNSFDVSINKPMGLQCGHTFCRSCLSRVDPALCPQCRAPFVLAKVQPSVIVMNFMELKSNTVKNEETIGCCETNKAHPMTFCYDCDVFFFVYLFNCVSRIV